MTLERLARPASVGAWLLLALVSIVYLFYSVSSVDRIIAGVFLVAGIVGAFSFRPSVSLTPTSVPHRSQYLSAALWLILGSFTFGTASGYAAALRATQARGAVEIAVGIATVTTALFAPYASNRRGTAAPQGTDRNAA